ncbi:MAG: hypothetical protein E6R04_06325 [Spirochaetes bacterium]|nr:MAG: hypothetical protein E6R04_06325 [Spirochaetota bacterium]
MTDIQALRTQDYSTNLELLSQQMTAKLAPYTAVQQASGNKAFRMLSQIDKTDAIARTTSAKPAINIDVNHDGRWVYPQMFDWGRVVDDIDLLQTNIQPQGAYVRSAVAALNRKQDDLFLSAFFGTAQTGETGSTSTVFATGNVVSQDIGGTASGLNVEKLRAAQKILLDNDVDIDMEPIYIAVTPKQNDDLLALTQVISSDFNDKDRPVLQDGRVRRFLNMNFVISTRLGTDGTYRRLPVWVPSGMGKGSWKEIGGTVRKRPDLQGEPDYVEASMMVGFTRLDEDKCAEIKCAE